MFQVVISFLRFKNNLKFLLDLIIVRHDLVSWWQSNESNLQWKIAVYLLILMLNLIFQVAEGLLQIFMQLVEIGFDLGFTFFNWVL